MQDKLFEMLVQKDEVTWQTIIYDLVKTEQLDPWNINITLLTQRYLDTVKKMKEHNFFISGKMLLASAILLKMKSTKLVNEHLAEFDNMLFPPEEELFEEEEYELKNKPKQDYPSLLIKTPQQRKRQVSLNDLMQALEKALNVEERKKIRHIDRVITEAIVPEKKIDITSLIRDIYDRVLNWFAHRKSLTFTELVDSDNKEEKILTFIPLLHLDAQQKVDLHQEKAFGEIDIKLL